MDRFFIDRTNIDGDLIRIQGQDVKHISGALRKGLGDILEVVLDETVYLAEIKEVDKSEIVLSVVESYRGKNEPGVKIHLYQGYPKGAKMDFIAQKATEVGISEINGLMTERTVVRLDNKKKKSKLEKTQKIIDEAAKQCKRDLIPAFRRIYEFDELIEDLAEKDNIIVFYEEEENKNLKEILSTIEGEEIHIIVGPEGGFSREEIDRLKDLGASVASLGRRILRTETAALVASSIILYEFGDI